MGYGLQADKKTLTVKPSHPDEATYEIGLKVSHDEFSSINIIYDGFHGGWKIISFF